MADTSTSVDQGRIVQRGSHTDLMRQGKGLYRRLVDRQFIAA